GWITGGVWVGAGLAMGLTGLLIGLHRGDWEHQFESFDAKTRSGDWQGAVADADAFIEDHAWRTRTQRIMMIVAGAVLCAAGASAFLLYSTVWRDQPIAGPLRGAMMAIVGEGVGVV